MSNDDFEDTYDRTIPETSTDLSERVAPDEARSRLDKTLKALSNRHRRDVLYFLSERDPATIDGLARQLAAWDADVPVETVSAENRDQIKVNLCHTHLPKLSDAGIIDYDRRSGAVRYCQPPETLQTCLRLCRSLETDE